MLVIWVLAHSISRLLRFAYICLDVTNACVKNTYKKNICNMIHDIILCISCTIRN